MCSVNVLLTYLLTYLQNIVQRPLLTFKCFLCVTVVICQLIFIQIYDMTMTKQHNYV